MHLHAPFLQTNPAVQRLMLPVLRADFAMLETYRPSSAVHENSDEKEEITHKFAATQLPGCETATPAIQCDTQEFSTASGAARSEYQPLLVPLVAIAAEHDSRYSREQVNSSFGLPILHQAAL